MSTDNQLSEDELVFYNQCLVYVFFKLKEFQNSKLLAEEIINKLAKQAIFNIGDDQE